MTWPSLGWNANLVPGAGRLLEAHAEELPQKDELCGAFCVVLALRAAGCGRLEQDAAAVAAGSYLTLHGEASEALPPGELGRRDYRLPLPTVADSRISGTTPAGIARAVRVLSDDRLTVVPVRGPWSPAGVERLFEVAAAARGEVTLIANVATGRLWGGRPQPLVLLRYLETGEAADPPPDWNVGHFICLLGVVRGSAGTVVLVADTYASIGWRGVHAQPVDRMAVALERPGMRPGGVLVVVDSDDAAEVRAAAATAGFEEGLWDNGTMEPAPPTMGPSR